MFDFRGANDEQGSAGGEIVTISSDAVPLTIDVGLPIRLNAATAWKVFQRIGVPGVVSAQLVIPAARAAVRDATAEFDWRNAATVSRNALAHGIEKRFRKLI